MYEKLAFGALQYESRIAKFLGNDAGTIPRGLRNNTFSHLTLSFLLYYYTEYFTLLRWISCLTLSSDSDRKNPGLGTLGSQTAL
jgi:hypothetical protein